MLSKERDWISSNDGEDNALPLWAVDDFLCPHIVGFVDSWLDLCRSPISRSPKAKGKPRLPEAPGALAFYALSPLRPPAAC